jgi:hypothetical protein
MAPHVRFWGSAGVKYSRAVSPTLLFPLSEAALAAATLGYYFRRRGPCSTCGRGAPGQVGEL